MSPLIWVPDGHAVHTYPVPAISDSTNDDGAAILDRIAGPLRGAPARQFSGQATISGTLNLHGPAMTTATFHTAAQVIDNDDLTPIGYDGHGAPIYNHQAPTEDA